MSTSWNVILKRFAAIFAVAAALFGISLMFSYDVIKIGHGSKKLKKWTQDLYKLCNKVLSDSNKAIPAERVV